MLKPCLDAGSCRLKQLELDRSARLLLHDRRPRLNPATTDEITNPDLHHVASAQLAVDAKVEQGPVTQPTLAGQPEADRPDLLWLQRPLCTGAVPGLPDRILNVPLIAPSLRPFWPTGERSTKAAAI